MAVIEWEVADPETVSDTWEGRSQRSIDFLLTLSLQTCKTDLSWGLDFLAPSRCVPCKSCPSGLSWWIILAYYSPLPYDRKAVLCKECEVLFFVLQRKSPVEIILSYVSVGFRFLFCRAYKRLWLKPVKKTEEKKKRLDLSNMVLIRGNTEFTIHFCMSCCLISSPCSVSTFFLNIIVK